MKLIASCATPQDSLLHTSEMNVQLYLIRVAIRGGMIRSLKNVLMGLKPLVPIGTMLNADLDQESYEQSLCYHFFLFPLYSIATQCGMSSQAQERVLLELTIPTNAQNGLDQTRAREPDLNAAFIADLRDQEPDLNAAFIADLRDQGWNTFYDAIERATFSPPSRLCLTSLHLI